MELETNHSNQHDLLVFKHVCKLCSKSYPSGKSLGGHMRSHAIAEARKNKMASSPLKKVPTFVENDSYLDANEDEDEDEEDDDEEEDEITERNGNLGNSGYGLRENPRKTWRIVNNRSTIINNDNNNNNNNSRDLSRDRDRDREGERVCKQCGKGFQSLKALCGHMSVHSNKYRYFKEEDDDISWSSDSKDQIFTAKEGNFDENNNINNNNKSSVCKTRSSSLSRYKSLIDFGSISNGYGSSSNNNSEIDQLEQEEVAMCLMMMSRDSCGSKSAGCFNFTAESSDNNSVILEGKVIDYDNGKNVRQEIENSDSGYFENGAKELESVDSVDLFVKNYGFGKEKVEFGSRLLVDSKKRKFRDDYSSYNISDNANKYECPKCNKSFKTHQALGGHIISHRKNVDNSFDNNNSSKIHAKKASASKKVKGHKCPYCFKVFKSGQALGGHKRSHMMGTNNVLLHSGGGRFNRVPSSPPPPPEPEPEFKQPLIDLNLPAPVEEEASDNSQFVAW